MGVAPARLVRCVEHELAVLPGREVMININRLRFRSDRGSVACVRGAAPVAFREQGQSRDVHGPKENARVASM
jgi:hypothetical protein